MWVALLRAPATFSGVCCGGLPPPSATKPPALPVQRWQAGADYPLDTITLSTVLDIVRGLAVFANPSRIGIVSSGTHTPVITRQLLAIVSQVTLADEPGQIALTELRR